MLKAIETRYKGYRFRSRLEARWAVFFDALGVKWEYEPEGFELPSGRYLPDFLLPDVDAWIEVKPDAEIDPIANKLIAELAEATGRRAMIVKGLPLQSAPNDYGYYDPIGFHDGSAYWMYWGEESADGAYIFCLCPQCGKVGIEFDGRGARVCGAKCSNAGGAPIIDAPFAAHGDKSYTGFHPILHAAANAAKSARFEYGEGR